MWWNANVNDKDQCYMDLPQVYKELYKPTCSLYHCTVHNKFQQDSCWNMFWVSSFSLSQLLLWSQPGRMSFGPGRVVPSGRKNDPVWNYFQKLPTTSGKGYRAKCKDCSQELQGIVSRLKSHRDKCQSQPQHTEEEIDDPGK